MNIVASEPIKVIDICGLFSFRLVQLCLIKLSRKMFLKEQIDYLGIQISILFLT